MKPGLAECDNAVIVPHIASASVWTRAGMVSCSANAFRAYNQSVGHMFSLDPAASWHRHPVLCSSGHSCLTYLTFTLSRPCWLCFCGMLASEFQLWVCTLDPPQCDALLGTRPAPAVAKLMFVEKLSIKCGSNVFWVQACTFPGPSVLRVSQLKDTSVVDSALWCPAGNIGSMQHSCCLEKAASHKAVHAIVCGWSI